MAFATFRASCSSLLSCASSVLTRIEVNMLSLPASPGAGASEPTGCAALPLPARDAPRTAWRRSTSSGSSKSRMSMGLRCRGTSSGAEPSMNMTFMKGECTSGQMAVMCSLSMACICTTSLKLICSRLAWVMSTVLAKRKWSSASASSRSSTLQIFSKSSLVKGLTDSRKSLKTIMYCSFSPNCTPLLRLCSTLATSMRLRRCFLSTLVSTILLPSGVTIMGEMKRRKKKPPTME
mmetsp:Transcript_9382/g.31976  ORF Transcript_9382/g.31976 Transcript_9382/m.31976 type:complete len:235 (-) Transcript_9382:1081-1785(-)